MRIADSGARPLWKSMASSVSASWAKKPSSSACERRRLRRSTASSACSAAARRPHRQRRQPHFVAQHLHRRGQVERAEVRVGRECAPRHGTAAARRCPGRCARGRTPAPLGAAGGGHAPGRAASRGSSCSSCDAPAARGAAEHQRGSRRRPRPASRRPARRRPDVVGAGGHRASVSRSGAFSGATSTSRDRPMVFIARAAEPMLPGCWVPTRTMRTRSRGRRGCDRPESVRSWNRYSWHAMVNSAPRSPSRPALSTASPSPPPASEAVSPCRNPPSPSWSRPPAPPATCCCAT